MNKRIVTLASAVGTLVLMNEGEAQQPRRISRIGLLVRHQSEDGEADRLDDSAERIGEGG